MARDRTVEGKESNKSGERAKASGHEFLLNVMMETKAAYLQNGGCTTSERSTPLCLPETCTCIIIPLLHWA